VDGYRLEYHAGGMLFAGLTYVLLAVLVLLLLREVFFPVARATDAPGARPGRRARGTD
jgi:hypothetical protein